MCILYKIVYGMKMLKMFIKHGVKTYIDKTYLLFSCSLHLETRIKHFRTEKF